MSDPSSQEAPESSDPDDDDGAVRSLLRGALREEAQGHVDVLPGVQRKLRERSGGKFYADVWSTAKQPPTLTFLVTSAVMLVIVLGTYAILSPLSGKPESVRTEPAPVEVLPPAR